MRYRSFAFEFAGVLHSPEKTGKSIVYSTDTEDRTIITGKQDHLLQIIAEKHISAH